MNLGKEHTEWRDKVMAGIHKAVDQLVRQTAEKNGTLILADENGKVKHVPAKELLEAKKRP